VNRAERLLADYIHALGDLLEDARRDLPAVEHSSFLDAAVSAIAEAWASHVAEGGRP
jgi:hypothetical protein